MPDDRSFLAMKSAINTFAKKHNDHPLMKDSIGQLNAALYDIEPIFMSPGQKAARDVMPTGQDPMGNQPVHE